MSNAESKPESKAETTEKDANEWQGGELLFAGGTDWTQLGRSVKRKMTDKERKEYEERTERYPNLLKPHRIQNLVGVKIKFIAAGCAACHCIAGDMEGRCFTWGRNEKGQLGHGDLVQRNMPTVVEGLSGKDIINGCGAKHHTAVIDSEGRSFTFGSNLHGQCGTGEIKSKDKNEELITTPAQALVTGCSKVSCGTEFTMWLCKGKLYAAGYPQYGQLGDGSDHEYNAKESSVKLMYAPQPTPLLNETLKERTIVDVTCGHNHSIAVDDEGVAFSWGFGGYGRLGHKVQQDEFKPRPIETFLGRVRVDKDNLVIAAGQTASFCTAAGGQLYSWGKLKANGDSQMYPQSYLELSGWKIRSMSCGPSTFAVAAERSVITWGHGTNGELAYGPNGKKSSANPDKCNALEDIYTEQVACGVGFTMFLSNTEEVNDFPVWECNYEETAKETQKKGGPKKNAGGKKSTEAKGGAKRKAESGGRRGRSKKQK